MCIILAPESICRCKSRKSSIAVIVVAVFIRTGKCRASDERTTIQCFENDPFCFQQRILPLSIADDPVGCCPLMSQLPGERQTWRPNAILLNRNETLLQGDPISE